MHTIAVANQKGGVGKTTVTLGLAAVAAGRGLSVVVVDLDPQANATSGMAVWGAARSVDDVLDPDSTVAIAEVVQPSGWDAGLFDVMPRLAPSVPALARREPQLALDPLGAQERLKQALAGLDADLVFIDCPPSLGLLTVNAMFAADSVLVVTEPAAWAVDGVEQILHNVARIAQRRAGLPGIAGVVVNRLARTRDARYWDEQLVAAHPDAVLRPPIRLRAAIAEAAAQSMPIVGMRRSGAIEAAADFGRVLDSVVPGSWAHAAPSSTPASPTDPPSSEVRDADL